MHMNLRPADSLVQRNSPCVCNPLSALLLQDRGGQDRGASDPHLMSDPHPPPASTNSAVSRRHQERAPLKVRTYLRHTPTHTSLTSAQDRQEAAGSRQQGAARGREQETGSLWGTSSTGPAEVGPGSCAPCICYCSRWEQQKGCGSAAGTCHTAARLWRAAAVRT